MIGNIHAGILIGIIGITISLCIILLKSDASFLPALGSLIGALLLASFAGLTALHMCSNGQPFTQWLLPGLCLAATLAIMRRSWVQRVWSICLVVIMFGLSQHYAAVVHTPAYIGNPDYDSLMVRQRHMKISRISEVLTDAGKDDHVAYPPGWLPDSAIMRHHQRRFELARVSTTRDEHHEVVPLWHTWLTGLYGQQLEPLDIWYPGGLLSPTARKVQYRIRKPGQ